MKIKGRSPFLTVDRFARMGLVWQLIVVVVMITVLMAIVGFAGGIFEPYEWFLAGSNPSIRATMVERIASVVLYALFSIGFTGLFITYIINWMDRRRDRWESGAARYDITDDFALVIGGHAMTPKLCARLLADRANRYVVVTTEGDAGALRRKIYSALAEPLRDRLIVYHASQISDIDLTQLNAYKANIVYILGDDGSETPDSDNMDTYWRLMALAPSGRPVATVPCYVLFEGVSASRVLYASDVESRSTSPFDFMPLFFRDEWARRVLTGDGRRYPGTGTPPPDSDRCVHILILGVTEMSLAVMRQAAHLLHFPNYPHAKTHITVVDRHMTDKLPWISNNYPYVLGNIEPVCDGAMVGRVAAIPGVTDIEWAFIEADPDSCYAPAVIRDAISAVAGGVVTIVVSNPDGDSASVATAFNLHPEIYESDDVAQVLVYQKGSSALIDEVSKGISWVDGDGKSMFTPSRYAKLKPFGMSIDSDCLSAFDAIESKIIAYAYQNLYEDPELDRLVEDVRRGDFSKLERAWQSLSTRGGKSVMSQRMSNIYSAGSIPFKAGWITSETVMTDEMVDLIARVEHYRWNMEQLLTGWRMVTDDEANALAAGSISRGELKSRLVHPDILSYDKLPESSRDYDRAIARCIPNFKLICRLYEERRLHSAAD